MKKLYFALTLILFFFISCNSDIGDTSFHKVTVNFDDAKTIIVNNNSIIELETNDSSLLYDICKIIGFDNKYVIHSRDKVRVFDDTGHYLYNIGNVGHSGNEYQGVSNIFKDSNMVCIYDFSTMSLLSYDVNGKFIKRLNIGDKLPVNDEMTPPSHLYKNGNKFVSVNCFGGDYRKIPVLSIASDDFKSYNKIVGKNRMTGLSFPDDVLFVDDAIFYWQPMCDTLFIANDKDIKPYCFFDLGKYSFPEELTHKDVYERIDYVNNKEKEGKPFAGMIRYYSCYGESLFFVCIAPGNETVLCQYDMKSRDVRVYKFTLPKKTMKLQTFLQIIGDEIIMAADDDKDASKNPYLIKMNIKDLYNI